jgi:hypothetical protein
MDGQSVTWGIVAVLALVLGIVGALVAWRRRASRAASPQEKLRMAKRAAQEIVKANGRTRRGSQRGEGTGAGTSNEAAASNWGGGTSGLP